MATVEAFGVQSGDRAFIRAAMEKPLLTHDRERELARRWRETGDEAALHELVSAYVRLVVGIATRFRGYGLPLGDLVQEGNMGLLQAAAKFEPEREVRFSTYARWYIRSAMQDFVLRNWSIVRTGTTAAQKKLFFNLRRVRARIEGAGGGASQVRQGVATALGVGVGEVEAMAQRLGAGDKSLNDAIGEENNGEWQDLLADRAPSPEERVIEDNAVTVRRSWLFRAFKELSPREQTILRARRLREESQTLAALGVKLGISKERVRQIEAEALHKLREALMRDDRASAAGLMPS